MSSKSITFYLRKFIKRVVLISFICFSGMLKAQDADFSQFYSAGLYTNPALAGLEGDIFMGINYKMQHITSGFPFHLSQATFIYPIYLNNYGLDQVGGVGLSIYSDIAGENNNFQTYGALLSGAYNLRLDREGNYMLTFGLQGGIIQKRVDFSGLEWGTQYNKYVGFDNSITPSLGDLSRQRTYPLFNAGLLWAFDLNPKSSFSMWSPKRASGYIGGSVSNINSPNESLIETETKLPRLYKIQAGFNYGFSKALTWGPSFLGMMQGTAYLFNIGNYFSYIITKGSRFKSMSMEFILGAWYRVGDSFILMVGFNNKKYSIGLSYDLNTTSLRYGISNYGGAIEISLSYRLLRQKTQRRRKLPRF